MAEKNGRKMKIASIGPTTTIFLREELKLQVDAVASKPTPEELVSSIIAFDRSHEL
jgi:uroporphyrinogen-III synthase